MAPSAVELSRWLGPAPGPVAIHAVGHVRRPIDPVAPAQRVEPGVGPAGSDALRAPIRVTTGSIEEAGGVTRLAQSFVLEHPLDAVWALMSDPEAVAPCLPGARLDGPLRDGRVTGGIEVRLGPVVARFSGTGTVTQLAAEHRQLIEGHAADRKGGSRVSGSVDYRLSACAGSSGTEATHVDVVIGYALTGLLAQLGRSGLARDLAQRIGEAFAQNLDARLRGLSGDASFPAASRHPLGIASLLLVALCERVRSLLAHLRRV